MLESRLMRILLFIEVILFTWTSYFVANGPTSWWWALWLAPLAILIYSLYEKWWWVAIAAVLGFALSDISCVIAYYYNSMLPIAPFLSSLIIDAVIMAAIVCINSWIVRRWRSWLVVWFFPAAVVSYSYLSVLLGKGSLIGIEVFSQAPLLLFLQITRLGGVWGLSFLVNLVPAACVVFLYYRSQKRIYIPVAVAAITLLVATLFYGAIVLHQPSIAPKMRVGLIVNDAANISEMFAESVSRPEQLVQAYIKRIGMLAKQGAQYIMQPEYALISTPKNRQHIINLVKAAAQKYRVTVLLTLGKKDGKIKANNLLVISPQGKIVGQYHKHHLVAGFEDNVAPGKQLLILPYHQGKYGIAICHDMDFINPARAYGKAGVGLLFVPAADFGVDHDGWWHARIAMVQAVANGYALARAARFGYITITDAHGVVLNNLPAKVAHDVFVVADVKFGKGNTIYSRYGNWFAWLCLAAALLIFIVGAAHTER